MRVAAAAKVALARRRAKLRWQRRLVWSTLHHLKRVFFGVAKGGAGERVSLECRPLGEGGSLDLNDGFSDRATDV